jgi:hypothetical protein
MELRAVITARGAIFDGRASSIVRRELDAAMEEAVMFGERFVKERTPQGVYGAQGGLLSTIAGEVVEKGTPAIKGVIGTNSPYGEVVEKGRTPGKAMPPKGSLQRWIEVKMGLGEEEAARIEFAVRRKLGKKGFEGAHMLESLFDDGWPDIQRIFEGRGFAITKQLAEGSEKKL